MNSVIVMMVCNWHLISSYTNFHIVSCWKHNIDTALQIKLYRWGLLLASSPGHSQLLMLHVEKREATCNIKSWEWPGDEARLLSQIGLLDIDVQQNTLPLGGGYVVDSLYNTPHFIMTPRRQH